jgi:hypothetical protein
VHAAPPRGQRSQLVEQLAEIARQPPAEVTAADAHDSIWQAFRLLTRQERESLTADELSLLLRAVVPRYDQYWKYLYRTPRRAHHRELTVVLATEWEARMRAVVAELEAKRGVTDEDWWFVLRTLANMGLASAVEAIVRDMPDRLRYAAPTSEFRLGAIVRWARNLIDTREAPTPGQVEYAHNTFWDIFRHMKSTQIHVFTLRLLLTTTVEVSTLVKTRSHDESMARLHELVDFIVKHGYGIDLHNIALSVQQLPTLQTTHNITPLSAKGLTAILRHLILRDTDPYRLVAAFDILSTKGSTATSNYSSRNDDDDDDDFGPPAAAVQEGDPDRRNWLGFKVKKSVYFQGFHSTQQYKY